MKPHRTDFLSLVAGLIFLALTLWWLSAKMFEIPLPPVGWFLAGALIVTGLLGVVGAVRSSRATAPPAARVDGAASDGIGRAPGEEFTAVVDDHPAAVVDEPFSNSDTTSTPNQLPGIHQSLAERRGSAGPVSEPVSGPPGPGTDPEHRDHGNGGERPTTW